jgi:hypothetical protein
MLNCDIYLAFADFKKPGRIPSQCAELARDIFARYQNGNVRQRAGVSSCWVTIESDEVPILGAAPKGWSRNDPVYENC